MKDIRGRTALNRAAMERHLEVAELLEKAGGSE